MNQTLQQSSNPIDTFENTLGVDFSNTLTSSITQRYSSRSQVGRRVLQRFDDASYKLKKEWESYAEDLFLKARDPWLQNDENYRYMHSMIETTKQFFNSALEQQHNVLHDSLFAFQAEEFGALMQTGVGLAQSNRDSLLKCIGDDLELFRWLKGEKDLQTQAITQQFMQNHHTNIERLVETHEREIHRLKRHYEQTIKDLKYSENYLKAQITALKSRSGPDFSVFILREEHDEIVHNLRSQLDSAQISDEQAQHRLETLENEMQMLEKQYSKSDNSAKEEIALLNHALKVKAAEIDNLIQTVADMKDDVVRQKAQDSQFQQQKKAIEKENADLKLQLAEEKKQAEQIMAKLQKLEGQGWERAAKKAQMERDDALKLNQEYVEEIKALKERLLHTEASFEHKIDKLQTDIENLEQKRKDEKAARDEEDRLREQAERERKVVEEAQRAVSGQRTAKIDQLQLELKAMEDAKQSLQAKLMESEKLLNEREFELDKLREMNADGAQAAQQHAREVAELEQKLSEVSTQLAKSDEERHVLQKRIDDSEHAPREKAFGSPPLTPKSPVSPKSVKSKSSKRVQFADESEPDKTRTHGSLSNIVQRKNTGPQLSPSGAPPASPSTLSNPPTSPSPSPSLQRLNRKHTAERPSSSLSNRSKDRAGSSLSTASRQRPASRAQTSGTMDRPSTPNANSEYWNNFQTLFNAVTSRDTTL
ncbi:hypothetical protein BLNAU_15626 [Blattamonas nauphoetae]|uniref:Uncharacterized protein n=1 Tax=Blattamonas nauphoetae TaxID=2049346 RepID=A0ABQ9XDJ5_9EUKA|nr:hypothetical protein BLNAU_15626 [Blattamonas nauphoetae]